MAVAEPAPTKKQPAKKQPAKKKPPKVMKKKRKAVVVDDNSPVTPTKKTRASDVPPPDTPSRERYANGNYCFGCNHEKIIDPQFVPVDRSFFGDERRAWENYPEKCSDCKKSFYKEPGCCKVDGTSTAWLCRNAYNHRDHECVFGVCTACRVARMPRGKPTRTIKAKTITHV